jgi:hypothetical protein
MASDPGDETVERRIDEALGFQPMTPKAPPEPKPPAKFPSRALRDSPGEAPFIENGSIR